MKRKVARDIPVESGHRNEGTGKRHTTFHRAATTLVSALRVNHLTLSIDNE